MENKIKLFEQKKVRTHWDEKEEKWYFSVIDVIEILTGSTIPKRYWSDLKKKLATEKPPSQSLSAGVGGGGRDKEKKEKEVPPDILPLVRLHNGRYALALPTALRRPCFLFFFLDQYHRYYYKPKSAS